MLRAGFAEVDITPTTPMPMGRTIDWMDIADVQWPLMARLGVFEDGDRRFVLAGLDHVRLWGDAADELRAAMSEGGPIRLEEIMLACSHTHNGPFSTPWRHDDRHSLLYRDWMKERLVEAVRRALADLQPVRIKVGQIDAPGWNINRRPVYRTDMGEQVGTQGPAWGEAFLRLEGPTDSSIQVLLAETPAGAPVGGIFNYACHPTLMYSVPAWSADFVGPLTEAMKARYGCTFAYVQGAMGNIKADTGAGPGRGGQSGPDRCLAMGQALAGKAEQALDAGRYVEEPALRIARQLLPFEQRRPTSEQIELAQTYLEKRNPEPDLDAFVRRLYGQKYMMYSVRPAFVEWHCREIIGMFEWQRRAGRRQMIDQVEVHAMAMGDIALVALSAHFFTEFGLRIKAESPFRQTFVIEQANGWNGYVPTRQAFANGGYEPVLRHQSRLPADAGDRIADATVHMLRQLA